MLFLFFAEKSIDLPLGGWFILRAKKGGSAVKINEVEALAGITKKNIRFYEEQGLLHPSRNAENGYRDYGDEELRRLEQIKLLRKLGVPIEEIRRIFSGGQTLEDCMRRHLVTLEREQRNLAGSVTVCRALQGESLEGLDTGAVLARMADMEQGGTAFQNRHTQDVRRHLVAPVVISIFMVGLMLAFTMLLAWACLEAPEEAPPVWFLIIVFGCCIAVAAGVVAALVQRVREIGKGEMDDAKRY